SPVRATRRAASPTRKRRSGSAPALPWRFLLGLGLALALGAFLWTVHDRLSHRTDKRTLRPLPRAAASDRRAGFLPICPI
ncbi:MAG: hypothetical protein AB1758_03630, partial [Candidatus Eremiobacterota bacterium]